MAYNGWMLPDSERARVLDLFPPCHSDVKATHVTLALDTKEIPQDANVEVVGYAADEGLEVLVCRVNGELMRPDGGIFHLTLSLKEGRAAKESNDVIANDWLPLGASIPIRTRAFVNRGGVYVTTPLSGAKL